MVFYKIEADLLITDEQKNSKEEIFDFSLFQRKTEEYFIESSRSCYIFISSVRRNKTVTAGAITKEVTDFKLKIAEYLTKAGIETTDIRITETTLSAIDSMIRQASRNDFISGIDIMDFFDLKFLHGANFNFMENILKEQKTFEQLKETAAELVCEDTLTPELERIFAGGNANGVKGHPVHYIISSDDNWLCDQMTEVLLSALLQNGRISNRRYCEIVLGIDTRTPNDCLDQIYKSCEGGAVVLNYCGAEEYESEFACTVGEISVRLGECIREYRNRVLTVLCLPKTDVKFEDSIIENIGNTTIVKLNEDILMGDRARGYLRSLAQKHGTSGDEDLEQIVTDDNKGYLASDLKNDFDYWFNKHLKNSVFPQYAHIAAANQESAKKKPTGSAYAELQEMIGLSEAKEVLGRALDYYKAQKLFRDRGMETDRPAMHMVFTGNPGTAKTSVARLFAQIMKENGILSRGDLYEVGRADLIGQYVGWTAKLVKQKFMAARGSVLFIDEAYSLLDSKEGMYGDEAINTIVQEMENHREDMIVIFAGYPDEMETFLERNPGLRSRIAFHVPFSDYSAEELYSIGELIAHRKGVMLDHAVKDKLLPILKNVSVQSDFGGGRYVRNLIESAKMKQASRLIRMGADRVTSADISTLTAEDFDVPKTSPAQTKRQIGFV